MAGSPTRTLRRVAQIEETALDLARSTVEACPQRFLDPAIKEPNTPLRRAWVETVGATMEAHLATERLGALLREKAGADAPSAFARMGAEMDGADETA
jgi:hypothetical protein